MWGGRGGWNEPGSDSSSDADIGGQAAAGAGDHGALRRIAMKGIVIPVKAFGQAKSRLWRFVSPGRCAALAEAMCSDVLVSASRASGVDKIIVVSNEPRALAAARANGWDALQEQTQVSESASVDMASRYCESIGVTSLLRLPGDVPLVQSSDIEDIFCAAGRAPGCVIVPSRDGTGTNALLRSPPTAFASHFGKDSFTKHLAAARAADIPVSVVRNPRLELDVDELSDIKLLLQQVSPHSHTGKWFSETDRELWRGSDPALCLRDPLT